MNNAKKRYIANTQLYRSKCKSTDQEFQGIMCHLLCGKIFLKFGNINKNSLGIFRERKNVPQEIEKVQKIIRDWKPKIAPVMNFFNAVPSHYLNV